MSAFSLATSAAPSSPHSATSASTTSGACSRQRVSALSAPSASTTSWPTAASTRAKRRRVCGSAWASTTFMTGGLLPDRGSGQRAVGVSPPVAGGREVRVRTCPRSGGQPARVLDVAMHLLDQRVGAVEAPLAAEALEEVQAQLATVEVALEVEQVGLHEEPAPGLERGAHADVDGRQAADVAHLGAAGVDAVAGDDERGVRDEVRGGIAQRAPAL